MRLDLRELGDEELVERLLQAGRSEVPFKGALAGTLRAVGASTQAAPGVWSWLWKLLTGIVVTAGLGFGAWALWPSGAPKTSMTALPGSAQPSASPKVLEAGADPVPESPAVAAPSASSPAKVAAAPSSPPAPSTARSEGKDKGDRLLAEVRALDAVRVAIREGAAGRALVLLDGFDREFPGAVLGNEARVLRIEALAKSGDQAAARRLGEQYLRETPNGPLSNRVRTITSGR